MDDRIPRYIAIEGPIGVGKTTLVEAFSQRMNARVLLEQFEDNPFLPKFYRDKERFSFPTEVFFLLSRFRQQEHFLQADLFHQYTISDYLFSKCRLFASLTLDTHELTLFEQIYQVLERSIPKPDLVIHLYAPVEVLLARIAQRDRSYERDIEASYLEQLAQLYVQEFSKNKTPRTISIDTTRIDFRKSENISILMELIASGAEGWLDSELFIK